MDSVLQILTVINSIVATAAAMAAFSAAYWTRQQFELAKAEAARPRPAITVELRSLDGQPEWLRCYLRIVNHAEVPIILETINSIGGRLSFLKYADAYDDSTSYDPKIKDPLPKELLSSDIDCQKAVERRGATQGGANIDLGHLHFFAVLREPNFLKRAFKASSEYEKLQFSLHFMDEPDRPFVITQNIRLPAGKAALGDPRH